MNTTPLRAEGVEFREGRPADLEPAFAVSRRALAGMARSLGVAGDVDDSPESIEYEWGKRRQLLEFVAAQDGQFVICERDGEPLGYVRTCRFAEMEEITDLHVIPEESGKGIGPALLERCWAGDPTPDLGRVAVAPGVSRVLNAMTNFGVMPSAGHWHLRAPRATYLESRSRVTDVSEPAVVVLESDRALAEWQRIEPPAIGHRRPFLHDFFARTRTCLAAVDADSGDVSALCWVGPEEEIGPAVGVTSQALVPVVLQALDRVAKIHEPKMLDVYCATHAWWLLRRLRALGFTVHWPLWVMSSIPLPGLDRYVPTRPAHLL